jgi:hypothetical protein
MDARQLLRTKRAALEDTAFASDDLAVGFLLSTPAEARPFERKRQLLTSIANLVA